MLFGRVISRIILMLVLSGCATRPELPPDLAQVAQCISAELQATSGVQDVRVTASSGGQSSQLFNFRPTGPIVVIRYSFVDRDGLRRSVEFDLWKSIFDGGKEMFMYNEAYAWGLGAGEEMGPVPYEIEITWKARCNAQGFLVTAYGDDRTVFKPLGNGCFVKKRTQFFCAGNAQV